jgi:diguanylate cyclase (GGDEF)-like protein
MSTRTTTSLQSGWKSSSPDQTKVKMAEGQRTVYVVSNDDAILASAHAAAEASSDWRVAQIESQEEIFERAPTSSDVLLLDTWARGANVYEFCRTLGGKAKCRTYVIVEHGNDVAEPIARFCGATGVLERPLTPSKLKNAMQSVHVQPPSALPSDARGQDSEQPELPEVLLSNITTGEPDNSLIGALIDIDTGLFNFAFLNYKLDEEFKRAQRFDHPLACVMLGFEGQTDDMVLRDLAGIFLLSSRDTDVLGRFDESSFLFLLPNTGPDGATIMAHRVAELAEERGLKDLVGDPLAISVGIATFPNKAFTRREDLYGSARQAFVNARSEGGGVVLATC